MHPALNIAKRAAVSAGRIILRHYERLDNITITAKQRNDFVSDVDIQAEQEIIRDLRKIYPDHVIIGEESGAIAGAQDDYQWIIDPLDGTTNYLHGFPHFCVSIGFKVRGRLEAGVIYDPLRNETFMASRGDGAQLNERRIRVSSCAGIDGALLATGIPSRHLQHKDAFVQMMDAFMAKGAQLRRTGSAALDLAYVAAGRLDGFWEIGLNPWDMAAGAVLVQEAGGLVGDFSGGHDYLETGNIATAPARVFKGLLQTVQPYLTGALKR